MESIKSPPHLAEKLIELFPDFESELGDEKIESYHQVLQRLTPFVTGYLESATKTTLTEFCDLINPNVTFEDKRDVLSVQSWRAISWLPFELRDVINDGVKDHRLAAGEPALTLADRLLVSAVFVTLGLTPWCRRGANWKTRCQPACLSTPTKSIFEK